ncbi:hypothetical protein [Lacrimispora sp. JR3]|uniref:hypothetical protein n=1 Tax=Lacrimispora sinapis TaxID=3111456 RepID=UPI00374807A3
MLKHYKTNSETMLALGSTCCLLIMKYYETVFYYRNINLILDTLYGFVVIPLFYFFLSSCLATIFVKLSSVQVSKTTKKISKLIDILLLVIYIIVLVLKLLGFITIGNIPFISIYWIVFIAWGCIFTIDVNAQLKKGETI